MVDLWVDRLRLLWGVAILGLPPGFHPASIRISIEASAGGIKEGFFWWITNIGFIYEGYHRESLHAAHARCHAGYVWRFPPLSSKPQRGSVAV